MKRTLFIVCTLLLVSLRNYSQSEELQQLMLNIEKLSQFKQMLSDLKKAYTILYNGYQRIEGIAKGNFTLHQGYLDGLLQVSPTVQRYSRVARIIKIQSDLLQATRQMYAQLQAKQSLRATELLYIGDVYARLGKTSLQQLEALMHVLTAGDYRMSDAERLSAIDNIYASVQDQWNFLQTFNNNALVLAAQRKQALHEMSREKKWFQLP